MSWDKKGVGLNPASQIHYIDHLAVVCIIMDIPLLFLEELDLSLGTKYYPGLKAEKVPYYEFSPEYLIANYDVSFMTDLWDRRTMKEKFGTLEKKYNKTWRNVHCPHGFSDKGFYLQKTAMEDVALLYGQNMIDMLKDRDVWEKVNKYVITGNYRYAFYKKHKDFYKKAFLDDIQSRFDKPRPLILYAPTWMDLEDSTTFFDSYNHILDNLPDEYNLIVKLHTRLELDDVSNYYRIIGRYEKKKNVLFLKDQPLVFPILAYTDIYIGDMSSIGYDFLIFNKPMFFLNKQNRDPDTDKGLYLFRCGVELKPNHFPDLYYIIDKNLKNDDENFGEIRKQVWEYTFGAKDRPFKDIKADIIKACADEVSR